jgi:hypothetical protein
MAFRNVAELAQVLADNSRVHQQFIHKSSHADGGAGDFVDLSMAAGTPKYNAYVGNQGVFTPLVADGNFGIYTGAAEAGRKKYLTQFWLQTLSANNIPGTYWLLDYVGFYPLIDLDDTAEQILENPVAPTRHATGAGLRLMLVTTTPSIASSNFTLLYTNQEGTPGRTLTAASGIGSYTGNIIANPNPNFAANGRGPFLQLANGDTGVRSVQSLTMAASAGGFAALVLVKPIAQLTLLESPTVTELDLLALRGAVPEIADDAYLNLIFTSSGSITPAVLRGGITIVRN